MKKLILIFLNLIFPLGLIGQVSPGLFNPTNNDSYWSYNSTLIKARPSYLSDASSNNFQLTPNGNIRPALRVPNASVTGSCLFDGNTDYITFTNQTFTGSFTAECWYYQTGNPTTRSILFGGPLGSGATNVQLYVDNSGGISWVDNGAVKIAPVGNALKNAWNHIAFVRSGSTIYIFLNGSQLATTTNTASIQIDRVGDLGGIGAGYSPLGYLSNIRLSNIARYTANFTPSTTPFVADANTVLLTLLNSVSVNNSEFLDGSLNDFTITRNGNVTNGSFGPSAGVGSAYFDGTGDYLNGSSGLITGSTYCLESWIYITAYPSVAGGIITTTNAAASPTGFYLRVESTGKLQFAETWGANVITSTATIPLNTWVHVAGVRNGSTATVYIGGTSSGSGTFNVTYNATAFAIGRNFVTDNSAYFVGFLSNVRASNTARYTAAFTPSTTYTSDANTVLFLPFSNAGVIDGTGKNNIETVNAVTSTAIPQFSKPVLSFNGTSSRIVIPSSTALELGNSDFTISGWINPANVSGTKGVISKNWIASNNKGGFTLYQANANLVFAATSLGTSTYDIANSVIVGALTANTPAFFQVVRKGNTWTTYLNFTQGATFTNSATIFANTDPIILGSDNAPTPTYFFNGTLYDIQIKKGAGVYQLSTTPKPY